MGNNFKRTIKLLDVVAENEEQYFTENLVTINEAVVQLLDPIASATFDRVILLRDKAIVQGIINKNIIYKNANNDIVYFEETPISFGLDVKLPGLTPSVTKGVFNRVITNNNLITIGPDNQGTNGGIDVQIFITQLFTSERLINAAIGSIDQKIVLDFIIKVSKYIQQDLYIPAPNPVFEKRNITIM